MLTPATSLHSDLAIVIGRGLLPQEIVQGLHAQSKAPLLIGIDGETEDWLQQHDHTVFAWEKLGRFFKHLKQNNINKVLFAGGVTRPKLKMQNMDLGALMTLPQVMAFMIGGDNTVLTGLIRMFGKRDIAVIGVHEVLPQLLSEPGQISGRKPSRSALKNIDRAFEASKKLGELDIGQAAVAVGGRVIAVEGIEGTDGMLERVADMRASGRLYETGKHGVLVKTMKPGQDMRADLPTIGPETVEMICKAGLRGVAIEAGRSLILARAETIAAAKEADVFIYGLSRD